MAPTRPPVELSPDTAKRFKALMTAKAQVFLCHSSQDKDFVRQLAEDLERLAIYPWFDEWEIGPGDSLLAKIGQGLDATKYVVAVLSKHSIKSNWCQLELREALYKEVDGAAKKVIPIRRDNAKLPPFLKDKLYINVNTSYYSGLARLASTVYGIPQKTCARYLRESPPANIDDAIAFVIKNTQDIRQLFDLEVWGRLSDVLHSNNISIEAPILKYGTCGLVAHGWRLHDFMTYIGRAMLPPRTTIAVSASARFDLCFPQRMCS